MNAPVISTETCNCILSLVQERIYIDMRVEISICILYSNAMYASRTFLVKVWPQKYPFCEEVHDSLRGITTLDNLWSVNPITNILSSSGRSAQPKIHLSLSSISTSGLRSSSRLVILTEKVSNIYIYIEIMCLVTMLHYIEMMCWYSTHCTEDLAGGEKLHLLSGNNPRTGDGQLYKVQWHKSPVLTLKLCLVMNKTLTISYKLGDRIVIIWMGLN